MPYRPLHSDPETLRRERPWVFASAATLAAVAGFVNVCVLGFFLVPVSHMTGAVSRLSIDAAAGDFTDLRLVLSIGGGFLAGAVLSGVLIGGRKFTPGHRYSVALVAEGCLLAFATYLLVRGNRAGVPLAAMACGVQNAFGSSYYGLVIRTTHVSGIVTDIGVMLGHWLRHRRVRAWKLLLLVTILLSFFAGGVLGAFGLRVLGAGALALPATACFAMSAGYYVWFRRHAAATRTAAPADEAPADEAPG